MRWRGARAARPTSRARARRCRAPRSTPTPASRRCRPRRRRIRRTSPTPTGRDRGRSLRHRPLLVLGLLEPLDGLLRRGLGRRVGVDAAADVLGDRLVLDRPLVRLDQLAVLEEPAEPLELVAVEARLID